MTVQSYPRLLPALKRALSRAVHHSHNKAAPAGWIRLSILESLDENAEFVTGFTREGLDYLEDLLDERQSEFRKAI